MLQAHEASPRVQIQCFGYIFWGDVAFDMVMDLTLLVGSLIRLSEKILLKVLRLAHCHI